MNRVRSLGAAAIFAITLLLCVSSCTSQGVRQPESASATDTQPESQFLEPQLARVSSLLDQAESTFEDGGDPETCYLSAFEILDTLATKYGTDLAFQALDDSVLLSYENYLLVDAMRTLDSLSFMSILDDLDSINVADGDDGFAYDTLNLSGVDQIPLVQNKRVKNAISYFTKGRGRRVFERWMERAGKYETMVKGLLREVGAPEELFYLAMIESGLNPKARSYARAVGMWQFIGATGKAYGLNSSWWYDMRRDPALASKAAGRHLLDLYDQFGDWYLALAGYNFSPYKIEYRLRKYNVTEYWDVPRLPRQTRNYVPTYLAAVTIASNLEKYDFEVVPQEPLVYDTVIVDECVDLNVVAEILGSTYQELKDLNPALLRWCTPPDVDAWILNIPAGSRDTFVAKYDDIPKEKKVSWVHHKIRYGETLSTIARRYRVTVSEIKRFNNIRGTMIRAGKSLVIPVPQNKDHYKQYTSYEKKATPVVSRKPVADVPGHDKHIHLVKKGDTLWELAQNYGVTITQIRTWNGLGYSRLIKPGQKLNIWLKPGSDSASSSAGTLAVVDNIPPSSPDPTAVDDEDKGRVVIHTVRSGDTLWDIAQSYQVSIRDIKRWNGKRSNTIRPGDQIKIVQN